MLAVKKGEVHGEADHQDEQEEVVDAPQVRDPSLPHKVVVDGHVSHEKLLGNLLLTIGHQTKLGLVLTSGHVSRHLSLGTRDPTAPVHVYTGHVSVLTLSLHNSDLRDSHEYIKKQVWGERIILQGNIAGGLI